MVAEEKLLPSLNAGQSKRYKLKSGFCKAIVPHICPVTKLSRKDSQECKWPLGKKSEHGLFLIQIEPSQYFLFTLDHIQETDSSFSSLILLLNLGIC